MATIQKRGISLLLVLVLILGMIPCVSATEIDTQPSTEPAETTTPVPEETLAAETSPPETTQPEETSQPETTQPEETLPPETTEPETTAPAETAPEETEPPETQPEETEAVKTLSAEHQRILDALPQAFMGDDPAHPYPYGLPVDNLFPEEIQRRAMMRASMSAIPSEMYDNSILRALEYTGYDVQWLKDNGYLYVRQYVSSNINSYAPQVLSDIGYDDYSPFCNGDETVADASTVSGKAPNIAKFESQGLVCASFVTYYLCNYLPNIEGIDTTWIHDAVKATTMSNGSYSTASVFSWSTGLNNLANQAGSGVTKYTNATTAYANLVPGDVIIFSNSSGELVHAAIYAGEYYLYSRTGSNGGLVHFIIHVGNSRGPEISTVEYMASAGAKSSTPSAWYHIDLASSVASTGWIEVNKTDPSGTPLAGAYFTASNNSTGETFVIGPTNYNGYAKSGELPMGMYTVTETIFPDGYGASGNTTWTVTLSENTPNQTVTIYAENQKITSSLTITKTTGNGENISGWRFGIYSDGDCTNLISGPHTTDANGEISVNNLTAGVVYVKELGHTDSSINDLYYCYSANPQTVVLTAGETAMVSFRNLLNTGEVKIVKKTNTGKNLSGWDIALYYDAACTNKVSDYPFTTDENGIIIVTGLIPGTIYVKEIPTDDPYWECDTAVKEVKIVANQVSTVTFTNNHYGRIKFQKTTNTGDHLDGWTFRVTDSSGNHVGDYTTDENGEAYTGNLPLGRYTVQELSVDDDFWNCELGFHDVTVKAGETVVDEWLNREMGLGWFYKHTNTGEDLTGWEITVYSDEACTKKICVVNPVEDGRIGYYFEPGIYYAKETGDIFGRNEDGYWGMDSTVYKFQIKPHEETSVTFTNTHYGKLNIRKTMDTEGALDGWQFRVTDASGKEITGSPFTSDKNGEIHVGNILPGVYKIEELIPNDSLYYCKSENPQTVTVKQGETVEVSFTNALRPGKLAVEKVDLKGEHLTGATFLLEWSEDGSLWWPIEYSDSKDVIKGYCSNPDVVDGTLTTNLSGIIEWNNLHPGLYYRITELEAPEGYVLLTEAAYEDKLPADDLEVILRVINCEVFTLPKTGSGAALFFRISQLLCAAVCGTMLLLSFRKKRRG